METTLHEKSSKLIKVTSLRETQKTCYNLNVKLELPMHSIKPKKMIILKNMVGFYRKLL